MHIAAFMQIFEISIPCKHPCRLKSLAVFNNPPYDTMGRYMYNVLWEQGEPQFSLLWWAEGSHTVGNGPPRPAEDKGRVRGQAALCDVWNTLRDPHLWEAKLVLPLEDLLRCSVGVCRACQKNACNAHVQYNTYYSAHGNSEGARLMKVLWMSGLWNNT